jgi:O-succinylbenzoate synthase
MINPHYIILKPGIMGGFAQSTEWISTAEGMDIGWWVTSALESNIGLNAICQYSHEMGATGHQGLGTGQLFTNNIASPLTLESENIFYDKGKKWNLSNVDALQ